MTFIFLIAMQFAVLQDTQPQSENKVTVAEIKAAWAETEAKTKSCRFKWTESRQTGVENATNHVYSVLLQNSDHLRIEKGHWQPRTPQKPSVWESYVMTFDAKTAKTYLAEGTFYGRRQRTGSVSREPSDWDNYHVLPVLMSVRPVNKHFSPINEREYSIAAAPVEIEGRELLELRPAKPDASETAVHYIYYVDAQKNFAISRVIKKSIERKLWQLDLSHSKDNESGCWLPDSWKLTDDSSNLKTVVKKVQAKLNPDFADDPFNIEFPVHTLITDRMFADPRIYILCDDGQKLIISSEDRKAGGKYLDYVAAAQSKTQSDRDPVPNRPIPLSEAEHVRKPFETHKAEVNVRYVPNCVHFDRSEPGYYVGAPAEPELIDQLKKSFSLRPAKHTDDEIKKMINGLPFAFRTKQPENLEWHLGGLGDDGNVGSWNVLGVDRLSNTLYFFTFNWDYAP